MKCIICGTVFIGTKKHKYCDTCRKTKRKESWRKYLDTHRGQQRERVKIDYYKNKEKYIEYSKSIQTNNNGRTRAKYFMKKLNIPKICFSCKTTEGRIDVHHKDGNPLNNDIANLVYVCSVCHGRLHRR